jgi:hypothetical protein
MASNSTPPSPVVFEARGMKPDVRLEVFGTEFHVHSVVLKLHSHFFYTFFDSADKSSTGGEGASKYEWVTKVVDNGMGWQLVCKGPNVSCFHTLESWAYDHYTQLPIGTIENIKFDFEIFLGRRSRRRHIHILQSGANYCVLETHVSFLQSKLQLDMFPRAHDYDIPGTLLPRPPCTLELLVGGIAPQRRLFYDSEHSGLCVHDDFNSV